MPLGSRLGVPEAVLDNLGPQKILNTQDFQVFANAGFRYFEALDGSLGPLLGQSDPKMGIWSFVEGFGGALRLFGVFGSL